MRMPRNGRNEPTERFKKLNKPQGEKIQQQRSYQGTMQSTGNKKDNLKEYPDKQKKSALPSLPMTQ